MRKNLGIITLVAFLLSMFPIMVLAATPQPVSITVTPNTVNLNPGEQEQIKATVEFSDGNVRDVTRDAIYAVTSKTIAHVSKGKITAKTPGKMYILVRAYGQSAKISVKVTEKQPKPAEPVDLTVTPDELNLKPGEKTQVKAILTFSDNTTKDVTKDAVWAVNNIQVVSVNSGVITAKSEGSASILIRSYGKTARIDVKVTKPTPPEPEELILNVKNVTLAPGETQKVNAIVKFSDGSEKNVTNNAVWVVNNKNIVSVNNGQIIAGNPGSTEIIIRSYGLEKLIKVYVENLNPVPEKLTVTPQNITLEPGGTKQLEAVLIFSDGSTREVTQQANWTVIKDSIASVINGKVTAKVPGATEVIATSEGQTAKAYIEVIKTTPEITSLKVTPDNITLKPGQTKQLTAVLEYSDGAREDVTKTASWAVTDSKIATVKEGKVTAISSGTTEIIVNSNNKTATASITVEKEETSTPPKPESIIVTPETITVKTGHEKAFEAIVQFSDGSTRDITTSAVFGSTNRQIATVKDGKIVAGRPGNAKILVRGYGLNKVVQVEVIEDTPTPEPVELNVSSSTVNLKIGEQKQLTATLTYTDGYTENVTHIAEWTSNNNQIASVVNGMITAKSAGSTEITVKSNGFSKIVKVKVTDIPQIPEPESLAITPNNLELNVGETKTLCAVLTYTNGSTEIVTNSAAWSTSNPEIASVDSGTVTGNSSGTAQITATFEGMTTTIQVKVKDSHEINTVPAVTFPGQVKSKEFQWTYNNTTYKWYIEIPQDLYDYSKQVQDITQEYYESDAARQQEILNSLPPYLQEIVLSCSVNANGDRTPWIYEPSNIQLVKHLADALKSRAQTDGLTWFETAEFALSFVQSIPYETIKYPQLPAQTVLESADCDGKSILMGALLREMGYDAALMYYSAQDPRNKVGHMAIGVSFMDHELPVRNYPMIYTTYQGKKYYFAETINEQLIGERIGGYLTKVYPINQGEL